MNATAKFQQLLARRGSDTVYHRDDSAVPCPCRTPEGQRDPIWHLQHTGAPVCNEAGFLPNPKEFTVRAFVQPIQSTRATRLSTELVQVMFGEVQQDDHLGVFPITWNGQTLNFREWGASVEDWIGYRGQKFTVVNSNLIPDPSQPNVDHHWEVALRLVK